MSREQLYNSCGHTKTQEALCDTPFVTLNCNIQIFERDISSDKVNKGNPLWLEMWRVNLKVKLVRYDNRWSCDVWSLRYILPNVTIWIAYSQKLSMCSLISAPIPPCHHFPSFPPLCPYWVISISPSTLIFQPNHPPPPTSKKKKDSTRNNASPPNSFQRHPLPLRALQREKPFIFDSRLSRNGSNVSHNHDKCNQAGFWWANGWTRAALLCQE